MATTTLLTGLLAVPALHAQQEQTDPAHSANADVTTLGEVRALKPEDDVPVDLYRFTSPVQPEPNAFNRSWREPPSLQEVGMRGGYVMMGINYAIAKTAQGLHTVTRAPDPIQPAIARPPPALDASQQRRALQFCDPQQGCAAQAGD
ncbi:MAG: hypothetical protein ACREPD_01570 [Stenotrophomonas sp.]|uniref:hypothetical protein n=1 Tax=Stenotrophomonas sp. TaxID=69392 RepID=UPI003D6D2E09